MKISRIKIENWRGISSREIHLDDGVTIIEGPNEIGKTTLVEALRLLIRTLDSSKAREVKSIQPVGEDVGSRIEADIQTGDHSFTYSKRFNKNTETTLHISSPKVEQFTGREAHEKASDILNGSVDLSLWEALLVDQGKEISQANLKDSAGLTKALDEAAGSIRTGFEETGLIEAVEGVFLLYFTPTGQPKKKHAIVRFENAQAEAEAARNAINQIEDDVEEHVLAQREHKRLQELVPELEANTRTREDEWNKIRGLKQSMEQKIREVVDANDVQKAAEEALQTRLRLIADIDETNLAIERCESNLAPIQRDSKRIAQECQDAELELTSAKRKRKQLSDKIKLLSSDREYIENQAAFGKEQARLEELNTLEDEKSKIISELSKNRIDDDALEEIRTAEGLLSALSGKRETAATNVKITAAASIKFDLNSQEHELHENDCDDFIIASETSINLPGVAEVLISPPRTAMELDQDFVAQQAEYRELLAKYSVESYANAVKQNQAWKSNDLELKNIKFKESQLLGNSSLAEIEQKISDLKSSLEAYEIKRPSKPNLPTSLSDAIDELQRLNGELEFTESAIELSQVNFDKLNEQHQAMNLEVQLAANQKKGLVQAVEEKTENLTKERKKISDEALSDRMNKKASKLEALQNEAAELETAYQEASPEATETKYLNAQQSHTRAVKELHDAEKVFAILSDRLEQARADGRYESLESAERELEESERAAKALKRQAAAASLLWKTLHFHRDETRKAYIRPLKDRIESLGEIVFGPGFEIEVDDDWKLVSRTLKGKAIPFDSLSVGAREQIGILVRLAVAQIISAHGGAPLIIDDALGFSDPSRLESMGAAISKASQLSQIVLMSCSPDRYTHVGNAKIVKLN